MYSEGKYSKPIAILIYTFTGFCAGGAFKVSLKGMCLVACVCLIQGIVMLLNEKMHLYIRRLTGALVPALFIAFAYKYITFDDSLLSLMTAMIMPLTSGTLLVEGLTHLYKPSSKHILIDGVVVALMLEIGVFVAMKVGELL